MADDKNQLHSNGELPEPDESSFFAPEPQAAQPSAAGDERLPAPASDPQGSAAEPPSMPAPPAIPEPVLPPPFVDLGSTEPHDFGAEADNAAEQPTQLLPAVPGIEVTEKPPEIPPFDAAAAQLTQVMPIAPGSESAAAPQGGPAAGAPSVSQVIAGSRVIVLVSRGPSEVPPLSIAGMPHVVGLPQGEALEKLQEAGLSAQVFNEYSELARGEVIAQMPPYGQGAAAGSEAVLLVSGGPTPVEAVTVGLPNVVGLSEADALARLQGAGLSPQVVRDFSANVPLGVVIDQLPNDQAIAQAPHKKMELWWLWALLVVAALVAAGGGIYYYFNRVGAVPNVVGLPQTQAEQAIAASGFKVGDIATTQTISASEVGKVTTQSPPPNTQMKLVDSVAITVSGGQKLFPVPDVTGKSQAEASATVGSAGLQLAATQAYSQSVAKGNIISQSPAAGDRVPSGTQVGVVVSLGVQSVQVPGVIGQTRDQGANTLKAGNLSSQAVVEYTLTGTAKGVVFAQYPTAGMSVQPGTIVGIMVSNGPPSSGSTATVSVPSVVGETQSSAQKSLSKLKLSSVGVNWSGTGRPKGEVVGQAPEAGTIVPKAVAVILFVSNGQ